MCNGHEISAQPDSDSWLVPSSFPTLNENEVHIWRASLDVADDQLAKFRATLSPDECERADRFIRKVHGDRFTASCGILRLLLSRYLDIDAKEIGFEYGKHGKPSIGKRGNAIDLRFNLSHSGDVAVFAFAVGRELGVDIEAPKASHDFPAMAKRYFSHEEVDALFALPEEKFQDTFYACWTRKEAYIKARGEGVSFALNKFAVSVEPGEQPRLLFSKLAPEDIHRWVFHNIRPEADVVGALAIEVPHENLKTTLLSFDPNQFPNY